MYLYLPTTAFLVYNLKGERIGRTPLAVKTERVFGNSRYVYLYSLDQIDREYTVGDE